MSTHAFITAGGWELVHELNDVQAQLEPKDDGRHHHQFDSNHPYSTQYNQVTLILHCVCGARMLVDAASGVNEIDYPAAIRA